ncbi:MAG: Crp/Fnr family transcriptional regulator [Anaerolineales bacterium]|uniref:Crp/Fnr family transcriptional regulator n=1 Tax=Candidatus Desulfolinea nitratireducens TaxID=2841698 RepID=A0A8J6THH7_9CHLR|nr:Crp/Fnr family transcriptional regulator [Candidatus Desulfolinea nitratireducens]
MNTLKNDDTRNLLVDIKFFEGMTPEQLDWVAKRAHRRIFPAGTNVLTIEQPGEVVYIILQGTVKIHVEQDDGRDVILAILGAGDLLGEMSLIDSVGRSASAVTLENSLMLWMDKETFNTLLDKIFPVARNLVQILSARLRLSDELIQALASLDVNGRVARQLLAFADKYGQENPAGETRIPIRLTQGDIADLVGASRKRVNQTIALFKKQDLLEITSTGRITICNREILANYCR